MLPVRLEILATTSHSTIFITDVFCLYSYPRINVSLYLYSYQIYTLCIWTGYRRGLSKLKCAGRCQLSEIRDALGGPDQASLEMHLVAEME